jgi:hypothetical protein
MHKVLYLDFQSDKKKELSSNLSPDTHPSIHNFSGEFSFLLQARRTPEELCFFDGLG